MSCGIFLNALFLGCAGGGQDNSSNGISMSSCLVAKDKHKWMNSPIVAVDGAGCTSMTGDAVRCENKDGVTCI